MDGNGNFLRATVCVKKSGQKYRYGKGTVTVGYGNGTKRYFSGTSRMNTGTSTVLQRYCEGNSTVQRGCMPLDCL